MIREDLGLENLTKDIKNLISEDFDTKTNIAIRLHYIYEHNLCRPYYDDIYDYAAKIFDLKKRTVYFYIACVEKCFTWLDDNEIETNLNAINSLLDIYLTKPIYSGFTISQMKACLSLNTQEMRLLDISCIDTVKEIEDKIKAYKKNFNRQTVDDVLEQHDNEDSKKDQKEDISEIEKVYSFSDKEDNKSCISNNFIPNNSDYEYIFRLDNKTLIKNKKTMKNLATALKMLRVQIENNSENIFYYAVVKIPKSLD